MEIHFLLLVPRIDRWDLLFARIMIRSPYQPTLKRCEDPFLPTEDREKFHLLLTLTPLAFPPLAQQKEPITSHSLVVIFNLPLQRVPSSSAAKDLSLDCLSGYVRRRHWSVVSLPAKERKK